MKCPIDGCGLNLPPHMPMCQPHWLLVPRPLRLVIWSEARQLRSTMPAYREAIALVDQLVKESACVGKS